MKSRIMLAANGNSSRPSLFAKVPLLGESTNAQLAVDCKSGRKLRHIYPTHIKATYLFQR